MNKNEREMQMNFESLVGEGYAETNSHGGYRITETGIQALAINGLLEVLSLDHRRAFTFGALIHATGFDPEMVVRGLTQLLNDNVIRYGLLSEKPPRYIFHLCGHKSQLHLYGGPSESPEVEDKYAPYVSAVLKNIVIKNNHVH